MDNYDSLTKDAKSFLLRLYKNYLDNTDRGTDRNSAKRFGSSLQIQKNITPDISVANISSYCFELDEKKLLHVIPGSNIAYRTELTNAGINVMENRFAKNVAKVLDAIIKLKSAI
ncbi:hypothetical protein [Companilactobacillus muriivasis]|uniref:hypothetical protein n=1 Tax=Companilactobacillus muriivasis TaxID=3081444 RepID=UPI0030C71B5F